MLIKRLIGWLADFYPDTVFYSANFVPSLQAPLPGSVNNVHQDDGSTALIATAVVAGRSLEPKQSLTAEFTSVTDSGKNIGDYRITIERLK